MMHILLTNACQLLEKGEIVAIPTETVYGLAASIKHPEAINRIFEIKKRSKDKPLSINVLNRSDINQFVDRFPEGFEELAKTFWPGPLTLILPVDSDTISENIRAGLSTAAFRVPNHPLTRAIVETVGPLVVPSANISGRPSATCWEHVEDDFGHDLPILDGGASDVGLESTIVRFESGKWEILRLGAISKEQLEKVLGYIPKVVENLQAESPCYAPKCKLRIDSEVNAQTKGVVVGFSDREYPSAERVFSIGQSSDPHSVAEQLYEVFRQLDESGIAEAHVDMNFPREGLWTTIEERLIRASPDIT